MATITPFSPHSIQIVVNGPKKSEKDYKKFLGGERRTVLMEARSYITELIREINGETLK